MTGAASVGIGMGDVRDTSTRDWMRLAAAPTLWPVREDNGSFGERIDRSAAKSGQCHPPEQ